MGKPERLCPFSGIWKMNMLRWIVMAEEAFNSTEAPGFDKAFKDIPE